MLPASGIGDEGQGQQQVPSPFFVSPQQHVQQLVPALGGAADGGDRAMNAALLQQLFSGVSSGGSGDSSGQYSLSLQEQQTAMSSGQMPYMGAAAPAGPAGYALPIVPPSALAPAQLQAMQAQLSQLQSAPLPPMPAPLAAAGAQPHRRGSVGSAGTAAKATKTRQKRPYKPPDVVQAERKQKAEVQEHIRKLELQLGRARKELEHLQEENKVLHRKAVVLSRHTSFRRCAAVMAEELTQSMTMSPTDWSQQSASQRALDSAQRGLPGPEVLEKLRSMSVEEAVGYYNGVVARVRELLQQMERGPDSEAASRELEGLFGLGGAASNPFGYLQVVNPPVFAQLMDTKLDPDSPVDRADPAHWRAVLASMQLSEEQEAQLIMLLQSHLQQAEQIVQHKSKVMQQLAEELSHGLLSLELSGSSELSSEDSSASIAAAVGGAAGAARSDSGAESSFERALSGQPSSPGPLQAKDELDRLIQLEYWLKFDFTGCVRKLLPAQQQALCMVSSWPFYPDQRRLEAAIKHKAAQLWDQLQRSSASST